MAACKIVKVGKSANAAAECIKRGELIIYPTDTVYGLGADATNAAAVEKVFKAKRRTGKKLLTAMFADFDMLIDFLAVDKKQLRLIKKIKGHYTFILPKKEKRKMYVGDEKHGIGVRIANTDFAAAFIKKAGVPVTATSANISGFAAPHNVKSAVYQVGKHCALAVDGGKSGVQPSTILDIRRKKIKTLRP